MLPYDYHRCTPSEPDSFCQQCARNFDREKHLYTIRMGVPVMERKNSTDEDCSYIKEKE